jgi:hypothetical protein
MWNPVLANHCAKFRFKPVQKGCPFQSAVSALTTPKIGAGVLHASGRSFLWLLSLDQ